MKKANKVLCATAQVVPEVLKVWDGYLQALSVLEDNPNDIMCCGQFTRCPIHQAVKEVDRQQIFFQPELPLKESVFFGIPTKVLQ